uniref:Uncharacterized protein n=1 Tax=Panagrolaimus superbus TaxID=310955 RepID=A0A914YQ79_9BILA
MTLATKLVIAAAPIPDYDHIPSKKVGNIFEFLVEISIERCAIFQFVVAPFLGAIGIKESECEKCFSGTVGACGIQFPPSQALPEHRPQIRPIMIQDYIDVKNGIKIGNYK